MCWWIFKKQSQPETPLYPNELVFLSVEDTIGELEYDIKIHEAYAVWVVQEPNKYPPANYGDYNWHIRWIKVYESAIHYLKGG